MGVLSVPPRPAHGRRQATPRPRADMAGNPFKGVGQGQPHSQEAIWTARAAAIAGEGPVSSWRGARPLKAKPSKGTAKRAGQQEANRDRR